MISKDQIAAWAQDYHFNCDIISARQLADIAEDVLQDLAPVSEWVSLSNETPTYGLPILIRFAGIVQHVTYCLDFADDTCDWLEPYDSETASEYMIPLKNGATEKIEWMSLEELTRLPTPPEAKS